MASGESPTGMCPTSTFVIPEYQSSRRAHSVSYRIAYIPIVRSGRYIDGSPARARKSKTDSPGGTSCTGERRRRRCRDVITNRAID